MSDYLKFIEPPKDRSGAVINSGFSRGYNIDEDSLHLVSQHAETKNIPFGRSMKDVIEFFVYSHDDNLLGWKLVDGTEVFNHHRLDYTDSTGNRVTGNISVLDYKFPSVSDHTSVLISPTNELIELGIVDGAYKIAISFRNDIVGSADSESKLVIKNISSSRTELKVIPSGLKTSKVPADIALSFEFENFANRRLVGASVYYDALEFLKITTFQTILNDVDIGSDIEDYDVILDGVIEYFGFDSTYDFAKELDELFGDIRRMYQNIITFKYNSVFREVDYYNEYVGCVDYITAQHTRFSSISVDSRLSNFLDFYREVLYRGFDDTKVASVFESRFDSYFLNLINFGNGRSYPILKYRRGLENVGEDVKHQPIVIKLSDQLPSDIGVGHEFYISNIMYSDDVVQNIILNRKIEPTTYKMRGPDIQTIAIGGTRKYNQDELTKTGSEISDKITEYFSRDVDEDFLNVDYSDFKNFVRHSSARKRLDVFVYKLAKLSQLDRELDIYDGLLDVIDKEASEGTISQQRAMDSTLILKKLDIEETKNKKFEMLKTLDGYERFMYFSDHPQAWPRDKILDANQQLVTIPMSQTDYAILARYRIMKEFDPDWILRHGTLYKPEPIPEDVDDFAQKSPAYQWYKKMAIVADLYDKENDTSMLNNIPEFITRNNDNEEFLTFINFIGHHFDLIHLYIDGMGDVKLPKNNPNAGIPNQLVLHMLGLFGTPYIGDDDDEIEVALLGEVESGEDVDECDYTGSAKKLRMSSKEKRATIWRRLLNNLPRILKTVGTEQSIRSMLRCYGVPDYLFKIREYGGVEYNTELSDEAIFSFDTFDYYLSLVENDQYISIPWNSETYDISTLEIRIGFDSNTLDVYAENITILHTETWSLGFQFERDDNNEIIGNGFGRFYFKIQDEVGEDIIYCPSNEDTGFTTKTNPIYVLSDHVYDIMIVRNREDTTELRRSDLGLYVKRVVDEEIPFDYFSGFPLKDDYNTNFNSGDSLFIGNYVSEDFRGRIDRLRIYSTPITEHRFENHILYNQSYDISDPEQLANDLIFKANFDYPYELTPDINTGYSIIDNTSFRTDVPKNARCFNFGNKTEYPYEFVGESKRQYAKIPAFGAQVFNNNKVRIEEQTLTSILSHNSRSTTKSLDRLTSDTNTLALVFSPTDLINKEILRFFGNFKLGDLIGNPSDVYENQYLEFDQFKNLFFKYGFGRVDFQHYMNIVKSYIEPSLFENLKKLVPARTRLISGLLIEPSLLERHKLRRLPIDNEISEVYEISFDASMNESEMVSFANEKNKNINYDNYLLSYFTEIDVVDESELVTPQYSLNYGGDYIPDIFDVSMFESYSEYGYWSKASELFKIEKIPKKLKRYSFLSSNLLDEESLYGTNRFLRIVAMIAGSIRANITGKFIGHFVGIIDGKWTNREDEFHFDDTIVSGTFDGNLSAKIKSAGTLISSNTFENEIDIKINNEGTFDGRTIPKCIFDRKKRKHVPNPEIWKRGMIRELVDHSQKNTLVLNETNISTSRVFEYTKEFYGVNVVSIPDEIKKSSAYDVRFGGDFNVTSKSNSIQIVQGIYGGSFDVKALGIFNGPKIYDFDIKIEENVLSDSLQHIEIVDDSSFVPTQEGTFLVELKLQEQTPEKYPEYDSAPFEIEYIFSDGFDTDEANVWKEKIIQACDRWQEIVVTGDGIVADNKLKVEFKLANLGRKTAYNLALTELDLLETESDITINGATITISEDQVDALAYSKVKVIPGSTWTKPFMSRLYYVVMHELGHALGITHRMWNTSFRNWIYDDDVGLPMDMNVGEVSTSNDLYYKPSIDDDFTEKRENTTSAAVYYYNEAFGVNLDAIPLETSEGLGTNLSHPEESNFSFDKRFLGVNYAPGLAKELMTGVIDMPPVISKITLGFLEDLGYVVDYFQADEFSHVTEPSGAKAWVDVTRHITDTGLVENKLTGVRLSSPGYGFRQHLANTVEPTLYMTGTLVEEGIGSGEIVFKTSLGDVNETTLRGNSLQYLNNLVYTEKNEILRNRHSSEIYEIIVTEGGSGYTGKEKVTIISQPLDTGYGAFSELIVSDGMVVGFKLLNRGEGYRQKPRVVIEKPKDGTPATAYAILRKPKTSLDVKILNGGVGFVEGDILNFRINSTDYLIMSLLSARSIVAESQSDKLPATFRSIVLSRDTLEKAQDFPVSIGVDILNKDEEHKFAISFYGYDYETFPFSLIDSQEYDESIPIHEYNYDQSPTYTGTSVKIIPNTSLLLDILDNLDDSENPPVFKLHISSSYGETDIPIFVVNRDSSSTNYVDIMKNSIFEFVQPETRQVCDDVVSFSISNKLSNIDFGEYGKHTRTFSAKVSEVGEGGSIVELTSLSSFDSRLDSTELINIETVDGREPPDSSEFEYSFKQVIGDNISNYGYDIPVEFLCEELEVFDLGFVFSNDTATMTIGEKKTPELRKSHEVQDDEWIFSQEVENSTIVVSVKLNTKQETQEIVDYFGVEYEQSFVDKIVGGELILPFSVSQQEVYDLFNKFKLYNMREVGLFDAEIVDGYLPEHYKNTRNLFSKSSTNTWNTTVDEATGQLSRKPPITRIRDVAQRPGHETGSQDHFWFLDDEQVILSESVVDEDEFDTSILDDYENVLELKYDFDSTDWGDCPTPTPTPTATLTPTPTPTLTPTPTPQ